MGNERRHLDARERHPELLLGDDDGPRLPAVAEHLLGVDEPAPGQDLVPDALRGGALRGDDGLLGAVEVGYEDPRRLRLGVRRRRRGREAAELDGAGRVGVLGLAAVALRQELHRRGLPRVHRAVFHHHLGKELEHLSSRRRRRRFASLRFVPECLWWRREILGLGWMLGSPRRPRACRGYWGRKTERRPCLLAILGFLRKKNVKVNP